MAKAGRWHTSTRVCQTCTRFLSLRMKTVIVYTGLRHSELCALAWEDIDLIRGTITVRRNLTNQGDFTPPKTDAGVRTVFLVDSAIRALKDQPEITRMRPPAVITLLLCEYGKSS